MGGSALIAIQNMNKPGFDVSLFLATIGLGIIVFALIGVYFWIKNKRGK